MISINWKEVSSYIDNSTVLFCNSPSSFLPNWPALHSRYSSNNTMIPTISSYFSPSIRNKKYPLALLLTSELEPYSIEIILQVDWFLSLVFELNLPKNGKLSSIFRFLIDFLIIIELPLGWTAFSLFFEKIYLML